MKSKLHLLLELFITFAKVGIMTFGGGYAMIPILEREICSSKKWVDEDELLDYYAIGQCTPGIIAVNTATFVGYKKAGIIGGITASLGIVFPSYVIITVLAAFLSNFSEIEIVKHAYSGIRVCVCVLILNTVIKLIKKSSRDVFTISVFVVSLLVSVFTEINIIFIIIFASVSGIVYNLIRAGAEK